MKGIIFTVFNKMVDEKYGLATWQKILDDVKPNSDGIYTAGATYQDSELFALIGSLSKVTRVSVPDLVGLFGEYTLLELSASYGTFFENMTLKKFLKSIDGVIHVEVKKLFPEAGLPKFTYEDPAEDQLVMIYESPRKLCRLAEGLMDGAAKYFKTQYRRTQTKCIHNGDDHCRFEIKFG